jgi:predicted DNA-binding transcriptional regulator YafY
VSLPPGYENLTLTIERELIVVMVYEGGTTDIVRRRVTPRALLYSGGRPYLSAYCHIDGIEKTYRRDRIHEFRIEGR